MRGRNTSELNLQGKPHLLSLRPNSGANVRFQPMGLVVVAGGATGGENVVPPASENGKSTEKEEGRPASATAPLQTCGQRGSESENAEGRAAQSKPDAGQGLGGVLRVEVS